VARALFYISIFEISVNARAYEDSDFNYWYYKMEKDPACSIRNHARL
jgi:hypothetical protein